MRTWLHAAHDFAREHGADLAVVDALAVYDRGGDRTSSVPFPALEAALDTDCAALARTIATELAAEVDAHQATMFAERFRSVDRLLEGEGSAESRILRVGLTERLRQILAEGGPTRALRVRGVIDYVYSQAALHWHTASGRPTPDLATWAENPSFIQIRPGVHLARLQGDTAFGPQRVSVLRVAPGIATLQVLDAWRAWGPEQDIAARVQSTGAIAAFSGGFFLYSEPDLCADCRRHDPVGLVASAGAVATPSTFRRAALVQDVTGALHIRVLDLGDHEVQIGGSSWRRPAAWVNRAHGSRGSGIALVAERVVSVGPDVAVPLNGVVLTACDGGLPDASPGDAVAWRLPGVRAAISGGPVLVSDGVCAFDLAAEDFRGTAPPRTFVDDETGDRNLLPRLAAGITADGALVVAAVDGRNAEHALGLGLHSLGELMAALGAERAMNLDGGSSKRLIVDGEIVDLPSIGVQGRGVAVEEVRPLHTAVLLHLM